MKKANSASAQKKTTSGGEPKFPYTTKPSSLRKLLQEIPKKPKPPKFDKELLRAWSFTDGNDYSMIRVLKAVGLLDSNNQPTELYTRYMQLDGGAAALSEPIRKTYERLFQASYAPYKESLEKLQNLFNIHSGGGERALDLQIQTFKALCEYASFEPPVPGDQEPPRSPGLPGGAGPKFVQAGSGESAVHINVHIHLPENKSRRDYEAIIEDIGRYIFGRTDQGHRDE